MKVELTNEDIEDLLESLRYSKARIEGRLPEISNLAPLEVRQPKLDRLDRIRETLRAPQKSS